ncbi:helix-turn-helix domain-containing protein [Aliikangiella maris]|uniref:Helix-turn-helix transcriptional regulator n=2 Tax=Aliikangiella maris TaxID=3162458 RepID=A0ABV3MIK1_9GAMM
MSLSAKLRDLRANRQVSLQVVADAIGVSKPHVWELEKGKTKNPSLELLKKLAKYYGVTIDFLAGESDEQPKNQKITALLRQIDPDNKSEEDLKVIETAIEMALSFLETKKDGV